MPHKVSPATTVCVTGVGCSFTAGPMSATSCMVVVMAEGAPATGPPALALSRGRSAELAEDDGGRDDGGEERGGGAVVPKAGAPVPSSSAKVGHQGGDDTEGEVGPGQPRQRCEEVGPERARDRGPQRPGDLGSAGEMVREGPADADGQDGGDPHQSGGQDAECAEPFDKLADRGPRSNLGGGGHDHPPVVTPLTSVADSVTLIWKLPTPMMPSSWVGSR